MILSHATNELTLSNVGVTGEFRIKQSAAAFRILSSSLYSNKIRAIIRELSTNALDSHIEAGKKDVPFEVHLPSVLEPWFAVKDFGMGLTGDQVVNIYTTYFESTKSESNELIGGLGLGSKSPFSYSDNFTVTAIKNGTQRIYSAFINELGVPSIAEMNEMLTDEGNGVEVKFSVIDRYDYNTFLYEAQEVYSWFTNKPNIIGIEFDHKSIQYKEQNVVPGVSVLHSSRAISVAVMGNIAYPLDKIPEKEKHFGNLAYLLDCGLVLTFNIGELDFAASREYLSYIPLTINSIRSKLELLNSNLVNHITSKVAEIEGDWDKALYLYNNTRENLYHAAVVKYVADTKFKLYDSNRSYGDFEFVHEVESINARGLTISSFQTRSPTKIRRSSHQIKPSTRYGTSHGRLVPSWTILVRTNFIIVLNDLKSGCATRASYHFNNHPDYTIIRPIVMCISHSSPDIAVRQLEYTKFLSELHNPPNVVLASTLMSPERKKAMSSTGIAEIDTKKGPFSSNPSQSLMWAQCDEELQSDKTYYYVALENHNAVDKAGDVIDFFEIKTLMNSCGIKSISDIEVYGVRKSRIKEIKGLSNWVPYENIVKKEIAKISDDNIACIVASEEIDKYSTKVYTDDHVAKIVGVNSPYAKYVAYSNNIIRKKGNIKSLITLCTKFGGLLRVDETKQKIQNEINAVNARYPLLKYFKNTPITSVEVAEYIILIDKLTKE